MASRLDDLIREHAERLDQLAGPIDLASVVSAERPSTVTLSDAEPTGGTSNRRRLLIAAAAVVVVIGVAGFALAAANDDDDQSPAPVATVSVAPTPTVATETVSFAVKSANDIPVTFTKPTSWGILDRFTGSFFVPPSSTMPPAPPTTPEGPPHLPVPIGAYSNLTQEGAWVQFTSVSNIYRYGCALAPLDPPVGPTVDDLVTAWANIAATPVPRGITRLAATTPVDITVDGYTGKQIELTVPDFPHGPTCDSGALRYGLWYGPESYHYPNGMVLPDNARATRNRHFQVMVLDVDGTRLLIAATTDPNTPPQDRAALEELLASIQIG